MSLGVLAVMELVLLALFLFVPGPGPAHGPGFPHAQCDAALVASEHKALNELFESTGGEEHWIHYRGWNVPSSDPCGTDGNDSSNSTNRAWYGVTCDSVTLSHVTELSLDNNGLFGVLPSSLANLSSAEVLQFQTNALRGEIPSSITTLQHLQELDLTENSLTSSIPTSIGGLGASLEFLYLGENRLTGILPASLGNLSGLSIFDCHYNNLTGTLPTVLFDDLPNLETLVLRRNHIQGALPPNVGNMSAAVQLDLSLNNLSATIPTQIGQLSLNLRFLSLGGNELTGPLPQELGATASLNKLVLGFNRLSGTIPSALGGLVNLTSLILSGNALTGVLPSSLNKTRLSTLSLYDNDLHGPLQTQGFTRLRYLYLSRNNFSGPIPQSIGTDCPVLVQLFLDGNALHQSSIGQGRHGIPTSLGKLGTLEILSLSDNPKLQSVIPDSLGSARQLREIYIDNCGLIGHIPRTLGNLKKLKMLFANDNQLTGRVPRSFSLLHNLEQLWLFNNSLSSSLPFEQWHTSALESLLLNDNQFEGSIPPGVSNFTALKQLWLYNNKLTGVIPEMPSQVQQLLLSSNSLSGRIPDSIAMLRHLVSLDLSKNKLTGRIPAGLFRVDPFEVNISATSSLATADTDDSLQWETKNLTVAVKLPGLLSVGLSKNCLDPSLDNTSLCQAHQLQYLSIDGLHSAHNCPDKIGRRHRLPDCVWNLASLVSLHASSNAYHGHLPDELSPALVDIDISYNLIGGRLPHDMSKVQSFLAKNNRIRGTLHNRQVLPGAKFKMAINRLSCSISNDVFHDYNKSNSNGKNPLGILTGNLWGCEVPPSVNDNNANAGSYFCGSTLLTYPLTGALVALCLVLLVALYIMGWIAQAFSMSTLRDVVRGVCAPEGVLEWILEEKKCNEAGKVFLFFGIQRSSVRHLLILVIILCSINPLVFHYCAPSDYSCQYWWQETWAYKTSTGIGLMVGLAVILTCLCGIWIRYSCAVVVSSGWTKPRERTSLKAQGGSILFREMVVLCAMAVTAGPGLLLVITQASGLVNVAVKQVVEYTVAGVNAMWGAWLFPRLVSWLRDHTLTFKNPVYRLDMITRVAIMTFVGVPVLVTLVGDTRCFAELINTRSRTDSVTWSFYCNSVAVPPHHRDRMGDSNHCYGLERQDTQISFQRPFLYSQHCDTAVLTGFAPLILLAFVWSGFLLHIILFGFSQVSYNRIPTWLMPHLPGILWPRDTKAKDEELFHADAIAAKQVAAWIVCLTFGFMVPYVAIVVALTSIVEIAFWEYMVRRYLEISKDETARGLEYQRDVTRGLEEVCEKSLPPWSGHTIVWVLVVTFVFFGFMLIDTLLESSLPAWWSVVVGGTALVLSLIALQLYKRATTSDAGAATKYAFRIATGYKPQPGWNAAEGRGRLTGEANGRAHGMQRFSSTRSSASSSFAERSDEASLQASINTIGGRAGGAEVSANGSLHNGHVVSAPRDTGTASSQSFEVSRADLRAPLLPGES